MDFYLLVKNDTNAFSVTSHYPNLESAPDVKCYIVTEEEYQNFGKIDYHYNPETKRIEKKPDSEILEIRWYELREKRNTYLSKCDWTVLPSSPLSPEKRQEWEIYRQELRDFPSTITDEELLSVNNVTELNWPTKPS